MSVLTFKSEDYKALPQFLRDYASYMSVIKGNSEKTVCEYLMDLRTFFRFMIMRDRGVELEDDEFEKIVISNLKIDNVEKVSAQNIIDFLMYIGFQRNNSNTTRMRKLSALKSFFHYAYGKRHLITTNPTAEIDAPKKNHALPKYLSKDECLRLLEAVRSDKDSKTQQRDYTIITLFLNTGMRLSELVGLNLESIDSELNYLKVVGKGNKERIIYLNKSAKKSLADHLKIRLNPRYVRTSSNALFISRLETRISPKTVQWMVGKYLELAGLGSKGMSVHKLRHTAATLMYQSGNVDIRVLKDILGHEQLNTTQIYTHVVNKNMENAMHENPLSSVEIKKKI